MIPAKSMTVNEITKILRNNGIVGYGSKEHRLYQLQSKKKKRPPIQLLHLLCIEYKLPRRKTHDELFKLLSDRGILWKYNAINNTITYVDSSNKNRSTKPKHTSLPVRMTSHKIDSFTSNSPAISGVRFIQSGMNLYVENNLSETESINSIHLHELNDAAYSNGLNNNEYESSNALTNNAHLKRSLVTSNPVCNKKIKLNNASLHVNENVAQSVVFQNQNLTSSSHLLRRTNSSTQLNQTSVRITSTPANKTDLSVSHSPVTTSMKGVSHIQLLERNREVPLKRSFELQSNASMTGDKPSNIMQIRSYPCPTFEKKTDSCASHVPSSSKIVRVFKNDMNIAAACDTYEMESMDVNEFNDTGYFSEPCDKEQDFYSDLTTQLNSTAIEAVRPMQSFERTRVVPLDTSFVSPHPSVDSWTQHKTQYARSLYQLQSNMSMSDDRPSNVLQNRNHPCPKFVSKTESSASRVPSGKKIVRVIRNDMNITAACDTSEMESMDSIHLNEINDAGYFSGPCDKEQELSSHLTANVHLKRTTTEPTKLNYKLESVQTTSTSANNIHSPTEIEGVCCIEYRSEFEGCNKKLINKQSLMQHYESLHAEKTLPCGYEGCDASFASQRLLKVHVDGVHEMKYRCEFEGCNKNLFNNQSLMQHYESLHAEKTLPCGYEGCDASFASQRLLKVHVDGVHEMKYRCEFEGCNKNLFNKHSLIRHYESLHAEKTLPCGYEGCDASFASQRLLKVHVDGVHEMKYRCEFEGCNKNLFNKHSLIRHYESLHADNTLPCGYEGCNASFASQRLLKVHVDGVHEMKYQCQFEGCNKNLFNNQSLMQHYESLHAEKTLPCGYEGCDSLFASQRLLKEHVDGVHEMKYRCEFEGCNKKLINKHSLIRHYESLHADNTLPCGYEGCDASFASQRLLKVHVDGVHEMKYHCQFEGCDRIFRSATGLKKHKWFHARDPEYFTKRPNPFKHDILLPLVLKEKKLLQEAAKKLNYSLPMPEFQFYVHDNLIVHRLFDHVKHLASHTLIWVPCKEEYKIYGVFEGHYVTTGAENKFAWLNQQLWILENPTELGCTHIKRDIYNKIQFDYEKAVIVGAFAYPWLAQDAKFTGNFDTPSSNCYKKDPALTLKWHPLSQSIFLGGLPRRFTNF